MSRTVPVLAPSILLAAGVFAAPSSAATFAYVDTFDMQPTSAIQDVVIGGNASAQFQYLQQNDDAVFRTVGSVSAINKNRFDKSTAPTANENYVNNTASFPAGSLIPKQVSPDNTADSYYHLSFDIGDESFFGEAHFQPNRETAVPTLTTISYNPAAGGVPEPAIWAELILGFGAAGAAVRSNRKRQASAATA